ncbi:MAG: DUF4347 domain-containing protein [Gammaproteobacteria bacterium]|nr:DUF4347 domain-containing protein [Gammaproteobacteria bacterium]
MDNLKGLSGTAASPRAEQALATPQTILALEPRIMLDGAALVTADAATEAVVEQETADDSSLPVGISQRLTDELLSALAAHQLPEAPRTEIVFIDGGVDDVQTLIDGISADKEVVLLDPSRNGVEQISEALAGRSDIDAIHILSHGDSGQVTLGDQVLSADNLDQFGDDLQVWGSALTEAGDILIYGCDVAAGDAGESFVDSLAQLTGADVAASVDLTGAAALGGDWDLESQTGSVEAASAVSVEAQENYATLLAEYDANYQDMNFSSATNKVGDGTNAGDVVLYDNVITIGGQQIDAIVRTETIVGGSMSTFDSTDSSGSSAGNETGFFSPQFVFDGTDSPAGYAVFQIEFIEGGTYDDLTNTGTAVTLQNVRVHSYDLDAFPSGSTGSQFQEFGGFSSTTLSTGTSVSYSYNSTTGLTRFENNDGAQSNLTEDGYRVEVKYDSLSTFRISMGSKGTFAYFYLDFGVGDPWDGSTTTVSAPTLDLDATNSNASGYNNAEPFSGSAVSFSADGSGAVNIDSTGDSFQNLNVSVSSSEIVDGSSEKLVLGDLTTALDFSAGYSATATVGGKAYAVSGTVDGGERTLTITESGGDGVLTKAETEALVDALQYDNAAVSPTSGDRIFDVTVTTDQFVSPVAHFTVGINLAPTTDAVSASGAEDASSISITLSGSDSDGSVAHFRLSGLPANGTLYTDSGLTTVAVTSTDYAASSNSLTLYFKPNADWNGSTTFDYAAKDNSGAVDASAATATITVTPVNTDTAADSTSVAEDNNATGNVLTNDEADNTSVSTFTISGVAGTHTAGDTVTITGKGTLQILASGAYTFTPVANWNGTVPQATYTTNTSQSNTLDITVTPVSDAAVIGGDNSGAVTEDAATPTLTDTGTLTITDADAGEASFQTTGITASSGALGSLSITSAGVWTYDVANADVQYLKDGETKTETFTVLATDGTSHTVTVTITGINDAAVIGGDNSGAVTEDAATPTLTDTGTLTITDADAGEASFQTTGITASSGALGSLSITSAGVWTYDVANADVQYLKAGETKTETFTVLATDGTSHTVTVTITGINDAAVIGGADSGTVTEDVSLSTGGSLTITDAETTEAVFVAQSSTTGSYGSFSIATSGGWSYSLNNDLAAVQALDAGDSLSESFSVSSGDGTSHTVSITILGTDGAVVFGSGTGVDSGSVTEDTVLSASGTLTSTNLDKGSLDLQPQSGTVGSYGSFSISAGGGWSYSLDNSLAAVQALGAGESLSDSFTVNAVDGSPHVVSVSILGVNDAPEAEAEVVAATEGGDIVSGRVSATDVEGDSLSYSLVGAAPTGLTFNGDGSYSFDPTGEVYNSLPEGETQDLVVSYQVNDGNGGQTTATLTITITGTNDAPQVAGLPGQSTRENEPLSIVLDEGLFSDVDNGDVLTVSATLGNGDPLPDWLSFDPGSRTFNGTPPVGEAGDFTIVVTVTDSLGASDQASFGLTVDAAPVVVDNQPTTPPLTPPLTINTPSSDNGGPTNQPGVSIPDTPTTVQPTGDTFIPLENGVEVNGEIPDTAITADEGDSTIEAGQNFVVEGEGGGQLTFDARLVSGDPLPEGVRIDSETGQIFVSGGADISELQIIVEARDESGDSAQASFTLTKEQSSDQQIAAQLAATAAGGLAPAEAGTGDVGTSGQETAAVAADANNGDNNQSDAPKPLQVDAGIPDQMVEVAETGTASFEVPVDAFVFAGESGNLTLEAKQANGDPLPDWVEFDPGTGRFEVDLSKAGDDVLDIEELEIRVIASDGAGNSAFAVFSVTVQQTEGEAEPEGDSAQEQAEPVAKGEVGKPQADKRAAIKVVQQQPVPAAADFAKLAAAAKPGLTTQLQAQGRQAESQALLDDLAALFTNVG